MGQSCKLGGVKLPMCILFIIFAWSSWIDINGLWVELPLLVNRLPEGWNLPAYFTVIIQLANVGPLLYGVMAKKLKWFNKDHKIETFTIYLIISIGAVSILLIAFQWHVTTIIAGTTHSTVLLILMFFLSLVDCTSSVTFLPFMIRFKPQYMTAFYIGEGMSGLLPTFIAFFQGAGEYKCTSHNITINGTVNGTGLQPEYAPLLFPLKDFFISLFVMLLLSLMSFSVLKYSSYCKAEHIPLEQTASYKALSVGDLKVNEEEFSPHQSTVPIVSDPHNDNFEPSTKTHSPMSTGEFASLLTIVGFICAMSNGVLPSIQTYSVLPYGHIYYSLAVKLSTVANPLACFLAFFLVPKSRPPVIMLTIIVAVCSGYIITIASYSPHPPAPGVLPAVCMVMVWIIFVGVVSYLKLIISKLMMAEGHTALFWFGVATQAGSFVGAIITFICVTVLQLLTSAPPCV